MTVIFNQFIEIMTVAEKKFKAAIADFPEHAEFLSKCYLVVTYNSSQFSFKKRLSVAEISERILLMKDSDFKDNLLCLNRHLKDAQLAGKKAQGQEAKKIKEMIEKIGDELNSFPLEELVFHDDFDIYVVFASVNMEIIQLIKEHPLVNKTKTCMCKACIRVFFY